MIDEKHIYRFTKPSEDFCATVDAALLKQAVRILADNAAKYTHEGDEIVFSLGRTDTRGIYICRCRIWGSVWRRLTWSICLNAFYRADEARAQQGTGLGLAIAKWIVDKHRGCFQILSRTDLGNEGSGSSCHAKFF